MRLIEKAPHFPHSLALYEKLKYQHALLFESA